MTTEKQKLIKLPVKDFAKKIICEGHLFLKIGEKKFYLMKPGVFVDPDFLKKYGPTNPVFELECVISVDVKEKFKKLFHELRYLQFEKDIRLKCAEIVYTFKLIFSGKEHFLSFALACHEEFCVISNEDQLRMHETDMNLYRKALYSSAFAIIVGMMNDFFHYLMLRDFYNLTFCMDMGLCSEDYSYYVAEACNAENKNPGSGRLYLEQEKASQLEKAVFFGHPESAHNFVTSKSFLNFPELAETLLYQHELSDGSGFPRKIFKGQVSSWEAVMMFSDSLVEIKAELEFERDVIRYLITFQSLRMKDLPVKRVYNKICAALGRSDIIKDTGS
jgi:hypothetical protein